MATRVITGLVLLGAVVMAVVPDPALGGMVAILLVVLGLAYPALRLDAEDATNFLVVVLAAGAASGADVLGHIPAVGMYLDGILDGVVIALYSSAASIVAIRMTHRLMG